MGDPILDMLTRLRERPAFYLGRCSAETLFIYLQGYSQALEEHTTFDISKYVAFIESLYVKYGKGGGGHSWAWVLGQVMGNDTAALDLFFEELMAFNVLTP